MEHDVSISECRDWEIIGACECWGKSWEFLVWKRPHFQLCVLSASQVLYLTEAFDCVIILTCITSFILCTRSVLTGIRLQCVSDPIQILIIVGLG